MRLIHTIILALLILITPTANATAFECQVKLTKAPCWAKYDVEFRIGLATPGHEGDSTIVTLDKNTQQITKTIDCNPNEVVHLSASYSPAIWQGKKPQLYPAKRVWHVPNTLKEGKSIWSLPICFSQDFSGVNTPVDANGQCNCKK